DQACKLSRFRVVTAEWTFGRDPRGAKENDRILHLLAPKISQRFEILRDNSYRACVLAVDKFLVLISEGTMGSVRCIHGSSVAREIDKSKLCIGVHEPGTDTITHIQSREGAHELALDERMRDLDPGSFLGRAGDDGIERFANTRFEQQRGRRFAHLALDL